VVEFVRELLRFVGKDKAYTAWLLTAACFDKLGTGLCG
jgi:hypothetical protein